MGATTRSLFINPRSDGAFADRVSTALATADSPEALEKALREAYPYAVVRERQLAGEPVARWYVYRDGRWIPDE